MWKMTVILYSMGCEGNLSGVGELPLLHVTTIQDQNLTPLGFQLNISVPGYQSVSLKLLLPLLPLLPVHCIQPATSHPPTRRIAVFPIYCTLCEYIVLTLSVTQL